MHMAMEWPAYGSGVFGATTDLQQDHFSCWKILQTFEVNNNYLLFILLGFDIQFQFMSSRKFYSMKIPQYMLDNSVCVVHDI